MNGNSFYSRHHYCCKLFSMYRIVCHVMNLIIIVCKLGKRTKRPSVKFEPDFASLSGDLYNDFSSKIVFRSK